MLDVVRAVFGRQLLFPGLVLYRQWSFFTRDAQCLEQIADVGGGAAQVLSYFILIGIRMFFHITAKFFFVDSGVVAALGAVLQRASFFFEGNPLIEAAVGNAECACGLAEVAKLCVML